MTNVTSYPKERIKVLLLENIHPSAAQMMSDDGLSVEVQSAALDDLRVVTDIYNKRRIEFDNESILAFLGVLQLLLECYPTDGRFVFCDSFC